MKAIKLISICMVSILIIIASFNATKNQIEKMDRRYVEKKPYVLEKIVDEEFFPNDVDKMISHGMPGTKETVLPVKSKQNYVVYEDKLYVTNNEGKTWLLVPDDDYLGYARISEYAETIEQSNIFISSQKVSIVYGGRGAENISIISTDSEGQYWSVGTISKTATHDLQNSYEELHIDFLEDDQTGYIVAVSKEGTSREKVGAFRSVNSGVTWDYVEKNDAFYDEIISEFEL